MNATTGALLDFWYEVDPSRVSPECREYAHEMTRRLIGIVKERTRADKIMTCKECAAILGVGYWIVRGLAKRDQVWHGMRPIWSERSKQSYNTAVVDIDEVRAALAKRDKTKPKKAQAIVEKPPAGWISVNELHLLTAVQVNTLRNWCRAGILTGQKYLSKNLAGRGFWNWHVERQHAIETVRFRIHNRGARGGGMFRVESIEITPLIRELWGIVDICDEVHAFMSQAAD